MLMVAAAGTGWAPALRGEVFVLKAGGRIEGQHLNPERTSLQPYRVRTEDGLTLELAANTVARVVIKSDVQQEYEARLPGVPQTVAGHWEIAEWCQEAGLDEQRRRHLVAILGLNPDHAEARRLLGYSRYGSKWMTQDEFLQSRGYVRTKGVYRLQQEIDLDVQRRERERIEKGFYSSIRTAFENVGANNRNAANSDRFLSDIRDPRAAPALVDLIVDRKQPRSVRVRCLDILGRLPPGLATAALVRVAMDDQDDAIRDRCLDELIRGGPENAGPGFLIELKGGRTGKNFKLEQNWRVNRAAYCLARLGYKDATLELIDALTTEHQEIVQQQGAPPGGTPLSMSSGGPNGGMGSFGVGGRPKVQVVKRDNAAVRDALTALYPGVNHQFDASAWKRWYIYTFTTTTVDMRRDE
jgi:hypothetical protein